MRDEPVRTFTVAHGKCSIPANDVCLPARPERLLPKFPLSLEEAFLALQGIQRTYHEQSECLSPLQLQELSQTLDVALEALYAQFRDYVHSIGNFICCD